MASSFFFTYIESPLRTICDPLFHYFEEALKSCIQFAYHNRAFSTVAAVFVSLTSVVLWWRSSARRQGENGAVISAYSDLKRGLKEVTTALELVKGKNDQALKEFSDKTDTTLRRASEQFNDDRKNWSDKTDRTLSSLSEKAEKTFKTWDDKTDSTFKALGDRTDATLRTASEQFNAGSKEAAEKLAGALNKADERVKKRLQETDTLTKRIGDILTVFATHLYDNTKAMADSCKAVTVNTDSTKRMTEIIERAEKVSQEARPTSLSPH